MKKKWLDLDNEGIGFNVNPVFEGENGHLMMEL